VSEPIWIREADVCEILDIASALEALRAGLALEAAGRAHAMSKTHVAFAGHTLHALGAVMPAEGLAATKTWAHTAGGATPLAIVWDAESGALRAVIEAFALGQLRTAAVAGVATDLLAEAGADELALCGTGRQALPQIAAVAAVRRLARVRVYGRDAARRERLVSRAREELGLRVEGQADVADAVRHAPIATLVTRAPEPFLAAELPPRGAHLNAIGAITPERAEFEPALLARCAVLAADSPAQVRALSAEFQRFFADDPAGFERIAPLCALVAEDRGRPTGADLTLFKAMGTGIADLSLARVVLQESEKRGLGRTIPEPGRATLRLQPGRSERT
jgi:ornithine cyclodeaminase